MAISFLAGSSTHRLAASRQVSTEGVTGFPGGHLYGLEPVTGLEPAFPPWEGGVLTHGQHRHIILNFQFPILNFEAPGAIPTPAAIERGKI